MTTNSNENVAVAVEAPVKVNMPWLEGTFMESSIEFPTYAEAAEFVAKDLVTTTDYDGVLTVGTVVGCEVRRSVAGTYVGYVSREWKRVPPPPEPEPVVPEPLTVEDVAKDVEKLNGYVVDVEQQIEKSLEELGSKFEDLDSRFDDFERDTPGESALDDLRRDFENAVDEKADGVEQRLTDKIGDLSDEVGTLKGQLSALLDGLSALGRAQG